jgi:hypothetical protein
LQHLVSSGISETGEERRELGTNRRSGVFLEDDLVDGSGGVGLSTVSFCVSRKRKTKK